MTAETEGILYAIRSFQDYSGLLNKIAEQEGTAREALEKIKIGGKLMEAENSILETRKKVKALYEETMRLAEGHSAKFGEDVEQYRTRFDAAHAELCDEWISQVPRWKIANEARREICKADENAHRRINLNTLKGLYEEAADFKGNEKERIRKVGDVLNNYRAARDTYEKAREKDRKNGLDTKKLEADFARIEELHFKLCGDDQDYLTERFKAGAYKNG